MAAASYPDRLQRLVRTVTTSNGKAVETFPAGAWYWCRIEEQSGFNGTTVGEKATGASGTVYVRNNPTLKALDKLTDGETTWHIESIAFGDDELVCDVIRFDKLILGE